MRIVQLLGKPQEKDILQSIAWMHFFWSPILRFGTAPLEVSRCVDMWHGCLHPCSRVALQQRQQQQQQHPLKSRSRTPLRGTMKNARRQAIKVTSDDKIRSNISHGDSLSSVLHTSSPLIGPKPRLVPCALHKSVLMDICPEYCERRAKAVPPLLKLRSKHSTFAPSSTPSILSPIVSDESSVSDSSCYPDSDLEEEI